MFECFREKYIPGGVPVQPKMPDWTGKFLALGDSNVYEMGVDIMREEIHTSCANAGVPGSQYLDIIDKYGEFCTHDNVNHYQSLYVQGGGNNYILGSVNLLDMGIHMATTGVSDIIFTYRNRIPVYKIVIGGLPFVHPKLRLHDTKSWKDGNYDYLNRQYKKTFGNVALNDIFFGLNGYIESQCKQWNAVYLDIYPVLAYIWSKRGTRAWYDEIHYGPDCHRAIARNLKTAWGIDEKNI